MRPHDCNRPAHAIEENDINGSQPSIKDARSNRVLARVGVAQCPRRAWSRGAINEAATPTRARTRMLSQDVWHSGTGNKAAEPRTREECDTRSGISGEVKRRRRRHTHEEKNGARDKKNTRRNQNPVFGTQSNPSQASTRETGRGEGRTTQFACAQGKEKPF